MSNEKENIANIYKKILGISLNIQLGDKKGKGYNYNYYTLDQIIQAIKKVIAENKIGIYFYFDEEYSDGIFKHILHIVDIESGEKISVSEHLNEGKINQVLGGKNNYLQNKGSVITYMRRYLLCKVFMVCDDDTDGVVHGSDNNNKKKYNFTLEDIKKCKNIEELRKIKDKDISFFKSFETHFQDKKKELQENSSE